VTNARPRLSPPKHLTHFAELSPSSNVLSVDFMADVTANLVMADNVRRVHAHVHGSDAWFKDHEELKVAGVSPCTVADLIDDWADDPAAAILRAVDPCLPDNLRWTAGEKVGRLDVDEDESPEIDSLFAAVNDCATHAIHLRRVEASDPWMVALPPYLLRHTFSEFHDCLCHAEVKADDNERAAVAHVMERVSALPAWRDAERTEDMLAFPRNHWEPLRRKLRGYLLEGRENARLRMTEWLLHWRKRGAPPPSGCVLMRPKTCLARQVMDTAQFMVCAQKDGQVWTNCATAVNLTVDFHAELARAGAKIGELWECFVEHVLGANPYVFADGDSGALSSW